MFRPKKKRINGKTVSVVDGNRAPYMQFGKGIVKGNPKKCLFCRKPIRRDDTWVKDTSAPDPKFGAYSVIIHSQCTGAKNQR